MARRKDPVIADRWAYMQRRWAPKEAGKRQKPVAPNARTACQPNIRSSSHVRTTGEQFSRRIREMMRAKLPEEIFENGVSIQMKDVPHNVS